ncbi:MAG TPA: HAMP domain-containing sensor histidine kinase [Vicinamibacterales bacterium]
MNLARSARLVRWGIAAAVVAAIGGWALERVRFGATDRDSVARVETEVRQLIGRSADTLGDLAARVGIARAAITQAPRDQSAAKHLFQVANAAVSGDGAERTGISVYDSTADPLAWAGLVSELPRERIVGPAALFVAPGTYGPRLVRVQPVVDGAQSRTGTIVVEQSLGVADAIQASADTFTLSTSIVPVALRTGTPTARQTPYTFAIASAGGEPLVEAEVSPAQLQDARAVWRDARWSAVVSILAVTMLMLVAPLLELRRRTRVPRVFVLATGAIVLTLVVCRVVLWFGVGLVARDQALTSPVDLLLSALMLVAIVWLLLDSIERRRSTRPPPRLLVGPESGVRVAATYAAAGALDVAWLWVYERGLQSLVAHSTLDLLHFSLHPLGPSRLAVTFSLVLLHAAAIWTAAAIIRLPSLLWRMPRALATRATVSWLAGGILAGAVVAALRGGAVTFAPLLVALLGAGACAAAMVGLRARARHASQAARVVVFFLALLTPALVMYPSLLAFATAAKEHLIATEFGPEAATERDALKERLLLALEQIDSMPSLAELLIGSPDTDIDTPSTDRAFRVWQNTDLATYRLKSAIELYGPRGALVSRFALRLPDYTNATHTAAGCRWDIVEEPSPFGADARHVFRASRGICARGRALGAIVVRVLFDYQTLPFISSPNPYPESLRSDREESVEGASARDVEFVVYGWSGAPLSASGTSVWALPGEVFKRLTASRDPFWTTIPREDQLYRVYFISDRVGIYALGYPVISWFGHLINLAELVTLAGTLYVLLLGGATLFNALTSRTPASGRALLREIRSSFYQKLFLAYVAGAIVPVVILAVATQRYVASQLRAGVEDAAARTATVAQRLVEDYATLQQRGSGMLQSIDDQAMGLVGRAIDQDVNLFDGTRLQATSERDLFASKLLPTRTPGDVYERIVLDRLPTYVSVETVGYLLAAAPVRAGGRDWIVTVPLTLRQQESERQIDELNRRVLFGAVLFSLLGAALGYWMAERVADPVNRLTRATRRIARGDLDARIAATSSDELRRLVEDFNRMAADLKRQRGELERTQRLEAWADMARQVAHDIKNPLTPIQLSAEHAQRVNADRGRPLSPVLDECVAAILSQVKLLRQISAEFSSFASSPTPRPEPTTVAELLEEVVEPYRTGLAGRVAITVHASRDLPQARIDRTLFARALTNVIENALHAMPAGGALRISTHRNTPESPFLTVHVVDTGMGMDDAARTKIFEPYFSTKATGTGLGLTIAKRNVELNGGTISVESERGIGTTVTMTLPIAQTTTPRNHKSITTEDTETN